MTASPEDSNRVIQGLWIGPRLSPMEEISIRSFMAHGHEYHLYTYGHVENLPRGTILRDANEIISSAKIFKYRDYDSYAGFSNHFRYKLLLQNGGWWADLDLVCLRPFDFKADYVFSSEDGQAVGGNGDHVNVGAIKSPSGSQLVQYLFGACETKDPAALSWGEIGPRLFAEGIHRFQLDSHVKKAHVFCPIPWFRWKDVIDPDLRLQFTDETYAIHLWNEMWRREGFDKDEEYDAACLYQQLRARYLTPPAFRTPATAGQGPTIPEGSSRAELTSKSPPTKTPGVQHSSLLSVSAVVLSKNGAGRLARCLESIQQTGFADEIVVCVDADTTDDTFRVARRFTPNVHIVATAGHIESALEGITALCSSDFVLRIDDDECLAGNWDKESFQLLVALNALTQVWVPTRWLVPPGDAFIASAPWFPDAHPRLYLNDPSRIVWPTRVHEHISVSGRSLLLFDRWINHYCFLERPRGERRRRCAKYRELNPEHDPSYYLYEDFDYTLRPCSISAIEVANEIESPRLQVVGEYPVGSPIDFSTDGVAIDYTVKGWGQPEGWGTWTVGPEAEICLPLRAALGCGAILSVDVGPYLNSLHPTLHANVLYRGTIVGQWSFDRPGFNSLSLCIPADLISGDISPRFIFKVPDARSPLEAGESDDSRLLGLGFKSLRLQHITTTASAERSSESRINGARGGIVGLPIVRRARPKEAFANRALRIGREALPGKEIDVFWDGMWIFRVDSYYFPVPNVIEPEASLWHQLAGLGTQYVRDAQDYWYHVYQPKAGDVVVDIGAGRGEDTLAFSRSVGDSGRVFAVEPHPVSFAILNKFCSLNDLSNVIPLNVACVAKRNQLQIETLPNWQSNYVREGAPATTSFSIEGMAFDCIWRDRDIGQIDLLKMNIEGAERDALMGCRLALDHTTNVCVAAHDFRADRGEAEWFRTAGFVRKFLIECGFRLVPRNDTRAWARDHIHGTKIRITG